MIYKLLLAIGVFYSQTLWALPVDLTKDWYVTKNWTEEDQVSPSWVSLAELPIANALKDIDFGSDSVRRITTIRKFQIKEEDFQATLSDAFSLHLPYISNVHRVFINGKLVHSQGDLDGEHIKTSGYRRHIIVPINRNDLRIGENVLRIWIASELGEECTIYKTMNDIPAKIDFASENQKINEEYFTYMLLFLYLFVGIYHGLFYLKRRNEVYNLYYAMFAVFLSIYMVFRSQAVYYLGLEPYLQTRIEYVVVFFIPVWLLLFMDVFFLGRLSRFAKIIFSVIAVAAFLQFFVTRSISGKILLTWQFTILILAIYYIYLIIRSMISRNKDAYRMLIGMVMLLICGAWDILGATGLLPLQNLNLLRFGFLSFVLGIAVVLANRFLRVHRQVEILNETLEKKVEERTRELKNTLTKVQELKIQQDGDYFLTSLLLDPLSKAIVDSSKVQIQTFTKQKKEFEFKGKRKEIGGDIIIAEKIELEGKSYISFVNGDAMGKSIQGAGGALVMGVVFRSVLKRTQSKEEYRNKTPERWLKDCFIELQSIFESFDGTMLISVVMGLIDEENGLLYFTNAEHPWTVLYRDGVAEFLERELELRKIGTSGLNAEIRIKTFFLERDDVIFIGSDGKDDLILGETETGERIINEDETLILREIEEAKAELPKLVEILQRKGEFSDDLTLIRIQWLGDTSQVRKKDILEVGDKTFPDYEYKKAIESGSYQEAWDRIQSLLLSDSLSSDTKVHLKKEAARIAILRKEFSEAIQLLEEVQPSLLYDNEVLLHLSYSYRKVKNVKKAIDLAEKIRARDPKHFRNLSHLTECYRLIGAKERAEKILAKMATLDPNHPQVAKLKTLLGS
ncbi:SpoIIE-like protein phosphatase domain protein [Leptospira ryugenii]|uniref:SpoIIE-like protein phosphatase domain protein n=1 Tax=Leptospira ryugenii TaxID=1917863 RepID=A0A2P2E238_9LEPT|nr:SpoIIE family protein phosphatase [Leptospira ryugenii]GBF50958.1 SpoIIE-like protein phosphatase domain protein [Leptospira ryugenii]